MKYLEKRNGELYVSENVAMSSDKIMIITSLVNKEKLIENEDYEKLIELQKLKHFSMQSAVKFWDNFNHELYIKILKVRNNE